ncbi:hypothetical protein K458DRAFT_95101 [Lentithecium fluviatile CBS 122367]|uniref:Uncharacterized protein n=1 Tax=Lentithecium fluviatile CBS 122367 TaxID=1168545 RepID=A0A6G1IQN0_9PLEO|nr:hypothetical protein K458DRAFT_95101 [Lentithecium fluviatile CBS 122367]
MDPDTRTRVNERAALSPLAYLATNLNPKLDISVNQPKLHPKYEGADRHFMEDSPAPLFLIRRRIRQRCHANMHANEVIHKDDFPFTHTKWPTSV